MTAVEGRRFVGEAQEDALDDLFAKGTRGLVEVTAGESRLLDRLDRIVERARKRQAANIGYAHRADRTGQHLDARAYRKVAEANRLAAQDADDVAADVRRGAFA